MTILITIGCTITNAQLIGTGLLEDYERNTQKSLPFNGASLKIAATTYTDTLALPFFEDFTGTVVRIDSIKFNTTDNLVRVYENTLNSFPNGTVISIGFVTISPNPIIDTLRLTRWYIKKFGTNSFYIDGNNFITDSLKISKDTVITNAFWRLIKNDYSTSIDSLKWLTDGNIYINNRYPSEPVSYNVATFDGLKSDGVPYNTTQPLAKGFSDNLTSLPINIKSFTPADNLYISYYWQHSGIGDIPESEDYIQLEFKDSLGNWNIAQTISGNIAYTTTFKPEIVAINNPIYFSKHFQFRFRSYGRLSGPYDIWNIDYIYLNNNRTAIDTIFNDKTIGNAAATFLKRYTSMPYNQFFADTIAESGKIDFTDNNLDQGINNPQFFKVICNFIAQPGNNLFSKDSTLTHFPSLPADKKKTFKDTCAPNVQTLVKPTQPIYIEQQFSITSGDTANIFYAYNNHYSNSTILWDYYAYDDGSPEWGVGANQIGAQIANKFTVNLLDTITHIDIYFTRSKGPNMTGRSILLSVWDENNDLVSRQVVQVAYGGFKRYKLNSPVIIDAGKDYYVGYQQNFVDLLTIGYDRNYDRSDMVYFNLGGSDWNTYSSQPGYVQGSMMIRPVFSKNQSLVTPVIKESKEELPETILYPVPADDVLKIKGNITSIALYDLTGRKLCFKTFERSLEEKEISTINLKNGLYLVELKTDTHSEVKKILIQHQF